MRARQNEKAGLDTQVQTVKARFSEGIPFSRRLFVPPRYALRVWKPKDVESLVDIILADIDPSQGGTGQWRRFHGLATNAQNAAAKYKTDTERREAVRNAVNNYVHRRLNDGPPKLSLVITYINDAGKEEYVGDVSMDPKSIDGMWEMGCSIDFRHSGQGVATWLWEFVPKLLLHYFQAEEVILVTKPENVAVGIAATAAGWHDHGEFAQWPQESDPKTFLEHARVFSMRLRDTISPGIKAFWRSLELIPIDDQRQALRCLMQDPHNAREHLDVLSNPEQRLPTLVTALMHGIYQRAVATVLDVNDGPRDAQKRIAVSARSEEALKQTLRKFVNQAKSRHIREKETWPLWDLAFEVGGNNALWECWSDDETISYVIESPRLQLLEASLDEACESIIKTIKGISGRMSEFRTMADMQRYVIQHRASFLALNKDVSGLSKTSLLPTHVGNLPYYEHRLRLSLAKSGPLPQAPQFSEGATAEELLFVLAVLTIAPEIWHMHEPYFADGPTLLSKVSTQQDRQFESAGVEVSMGF